MALFLTQAPAQSYQAPGRLVDIGHRKLHLNCQGHGSPAFILEAGGGAYSIDWTLVQARVAQRTRVCSYDRAGLGWSDPGPADETVEQTVADLHLLLQTAGERPPYVLVGASVGGAYIQAYQHTFPKEIAGLVFSNSSNRIGIRTKSKDGLIWSLTEDEIRSAYPLPASAKGAEPAYEGPPFDRLPPALQAERLWLDRRSWEKFDPATTGPEATLSWRSEFLREFEQAEHSGPPALGRLPVVIISSNPAAGREECLSRATAASCLDGLSANTVHITASGSGHEIHLYQPDIVIKALQEVMFAVRRAAPLSGRHVANKSQEMA